MERIRVEVVMDEGVVAQVRQFLGLSKEYESAALVITEMFYLKDAGFNAIDLRHKVSVSTLE